MGVGGVGVKVSLAWWGGGGEMQRSWVHQEAASVWTGPAWIATVGVGPA